MSDADVLLNNNNATQCILLLLLLLFTNITKQLTFHINSILVDTSFVFNSYIHQGYILDLHIEVEGTVVEGFHFSMKPPQDIIFFIYSDWSKTAQLTYLILKACLQISLFPILNFSLSCLIVHLLPFHYNPHDLNHFSVSIEYHFIHCSSVLIASKLNKISCQRNNEKKTCVKYIALHQSITVLADHLQHLQLYVYHCCPQLGYQLGD